MALQDNFNAIYNKKEHLQAEKQKIKQHDIALEVQLLENLHEAQLDFITENDKNMLLLPKTKRQLITEVLQTSNIPVNKKSKYADIENQRIFLLKKYDIITNKTLRLVKTFDKMQEEKEAERLKEEYKNTTFEEIPQKQINHKHYFNWSGLLKLCGYLIIIPILIIWGMIDGIMKNKR